VIRSIHLRNFESHRDTFIVLSIGLNVFVGMSDAGKSAVFRALNWVTNNRPTGDWMVPLFWKGPTEVEIALDDGVVVTRRKEGAKNEYVIEAEERVLLTGFGVEVPDRVKKALRLDDINFQDQISLPFLMFDPSSERARVLNRVAGLSEIDRTLGAAETELRRLRAVVTGDTETIERLGIGLDSYDDIGARETAVEVVEALEKRIQAGNARRGDLSVVSQLLTEVTSGIRSVAIPSGDHLPEAGAALSRIREKRGRQRMLVDIVDNFSDLRWKLEAAERILVAREWHTKAAALMTAVRAAVLRVQTLVTAMINLTTVRQVIEEKDAECEELFRQLPNVCPTCGQPIAG
jgi:exonuclease SbcC